MPDPTQLQEARERLEAGIARRKWYPDVNVRKDDLATVLTALQQAEAEVKKWRSAFAEYGPKIEAVHDATATERDRALARAEQAEAERDEARGEVERLRGALSRLLAGAEHIFDKHPVRDWDETLCEARAALHQPNPPEDTEA